MIYLLVGLGAWASLSLFFVALCMSAAIGDKAYAEYFAKPRRHRSKVG